LLKLCFLCPPPDAPTPIVMGQGCSACTLISTDRQTNADDGVPRITNMAPAESQSPWPSIGSTGMKRARLPTPSLSLSEPVQPRDSWGEENAWGTCKASNDQWGEVQTAKKPSKELATVDAWSHRGEASDGKRRQSWSPPPSPRGKKKTQQEKRRWSWHGPPE